MIRPVTPLDIFRCALLGELGGENRARTLASLSTGKPPRLPMPPVSLGVAGGVVGLPRKGATWVACERSRVVALATAAQRAGPQSWDITHLVLAPHSERQLPELLEKLSQRAVSNGAERAFLRLRRDDPVIDAVRLSGFFPCFSQVLYGCSPRRDNAKRQPVAVATSGPLRLKRQEDEYGLFRLYNAATPAPIRHTMGVTFDQWTASRERCPGRRREYVLETNAGVRGWLSVSRQGASGHLAAVVHPDDERNLTTLVDLGLEWLRGVKAVRCLVAEHQVALQRALEWRGFRPESEYVTLVKSMAVQAKEDARARATVEST